MDLSGKGPVRVARGQRVKQHRAVAVDHGQQVVEVVSDASSEAADAVQFQSLEILLPQHPLFGDLEADAGQLRYAPSTPPQRRDAPLKPPSPPLGVDQSVFLQRVRFFEA